MVPVALTAGPAKGPMYPEVRVKLVVVSERASGTPRPLASFVTKAAADTVSLNKTLALPDVWTPIAVVVSNTVSVVTPAGIWPDGWAERVGYSVFSTDTDNPLSGEGRSNFE